MGRSARRGNTNSRNNRSYASTKGERRSSQREKAVQAKTYKPEPPVQSFNERVRKPLEYLTENQRILGALIRALTCIFALGPAGTGKTHIAIAEQLPWFFSNKDNKLMLLNPGTEIGTKLGILPGDKDDKIAVAVRPLRDILYKLLGASHVDSLVDSGRIMFEPLGSILGTTFDDTTIIFDEAQNSTPEQMKALLTRLGQRSKIIIAGDFKEQKFIEGISGMEDAYRRLKNRPGVGSVEFTVDDIVRSDFCKDVILAYRDNSDFDKLTGIPQRINN